MKKTQDWNEQIANWETSGLSRRAYCIREGLSYSTFQYNYKKYRKNQQDEAEFQSVGFVDDEFLKEGNPSDLFSFTITSDGSLKIELNISFNFSTAGFL